MPTHTGAGECNIRYTDRGGRPMLGRSKPRTEEADR